MIPRLLVLLFLTLFALHADVEDHLKPALGKTHAHTMPGVDFIYMINLDQRPEKFSLSAEKLAPYGVFPYRFSAVNGWQLTLETINDVGVKFAPGMASDGWGTYYSEDFGGVFQHEILSKIGRNYFCHCMSRGAIGIVLSHLSILQDAYDAGYETIWVMEDDIAVLQDPHLISDLIEELDLAVGKQGWDILFTDRDTKNQDGNYVPCTAFAWRPDFAPANPSKFAEQVDVTSRIRRIGARYGAYSMIVRRSGMKKILNYYASHQIFLPYDMEFPLVPHIQLFSVLDDVVSTEPKALSDNGAPNYENKP
ncbi:MAG: glycosyltransferase family 25 protein [Verrucomicrobia bacterium]|nr:glycosyltransferase family 25 protein [Verrucomicrobiota bacterium]